MSKGKLRIVVEVCADCGALDPTWASINRGILLCDECCSVHRSLGRHVSQVKSLKRDTWSSSQLAMVQSLHTSGANNIWEHSLLDPTHAKSGRRKPAPKDPLNPNKADFIRAKHQMFAFVYRPNKDDTWTADGDVSKQLHSCVRTANLETCLRLLCLGADPNYFHPDAGTRPVHVAAKAGQLSQLELLVAYGADPGSCDWEGNTAADYARRFEHGDLADRLVELQYEVTDRLAHYVCGRKADHLSGHHYITPEMSDSLDMSEFSKTAKRKLQELSNNLFEELVMDVYDEVDRRHNDKIARQAVTCVTVDRCTVPFLPVNPEYTSTRNQGRQKLARFNTRELMTLIIDILSETRLRHLGLATASAAPASSKPNGNNPYLTCKRPIMPLGCPARPLKKDGTRVSDDEPLYDSVASDDESNQLAIASSAVPTVFQKGAVEPSRGNYMAADDYGMLNSQLALAEARIRQLLSSNEDMKQMIANLQTMVHKLVSENETLRSHVQSVVQSTTYPGMPNGHDPPKASSPAFEGRSRGSREGAAGVTRSPRGSQRPQSMYEPREQRQRHGLHDPGGDGQRKSVDDGDLHLMTSRVEADQRGHQAPATSPQPLSCPPFPSYVEVEGKTKAIALMIQELRDLAKENRQKSYVVCAEKIHGAVLEMVGSFPESIADDQVREALVELRRSALSLHTETKAILKSSDAVAAADQEQVTRHIVDCAYDIARALKVLMLQMK